MKAHVGFLISLWLFINIMDFIHGIIWADVHFQYSVAACDSVARIDYIFPGKLLGCYMGTAP